MPWTGTREAILEGLLALGTHPTADEVLAAASRRRPGIGRATVYRTLDQFVAMGVLTKASHPGAAVRYDANLVPHHHLVCLGCHRIVDVEDDRLDAIPVPDTRRLGFVVTDVQVQLRGLCRECRAKEK